jgi:CheY-specific phosphatase CheX
VGQTNLPKAGPVLEARVAFFGRPSGFLFVSLCCPAARLLAASFLGEDEDSLTDEDVKLVVCELTNMLCGSLVSRLENDQTFDLTAPEMVLSPSNTPLRTAPASAQQKFALEKGTLTVSLFLEPDA